MWDIEMGRNGKLGIPHGNGMGMGVSEKNGNGREWE